MEWVGLLAVVALLFVGLVAAGVRVPGAALAWAVGQRILCAAAFADGCGDEPILIAAYGTEVGQLVRRHMPSIAFERGSRAVPVDFRRCRRTSCSDGAEHGLVDRSDSGLPVTAFVHVVDCRPGREAAVARSPGPEAAVARFEENAPGFASAGSELGGESWPGAGTRTAGGRAAARAKAPDCSGPRAGNLYIQYWTYYADSATLRGVPVIGARGYHRDDWEGVQIRIEPDGSVEERASSHRGYNFSKGTANWGSDAGLGPLRELAEALGAREPGGWGPETRLLLVSGGSHAGNARGLVHIDRVTPGRRVHLVPLEPIAATRSTASAATPNASAGRPFAAAADAYRFAISPPWRKRVWLDPEAVGTD